MACLVLAVSVALAVLSLDGHEARAAGSGDLAAILSRANAWGKRIQSGRLSLRTEAVFPRDSSSEFVENTEVWFDGVRSRVEQRRRCPRAQDETSKRQENWTVFDGKRVVHTCPPDFAVARVAYPRELSQLAHYVGGVRPIPLYHLIAPTLNHSPPLGDWIAAHGARLEGEERVHDLGCVRLVAEQKLPREAVVTHRWWLAPSKGYALARYSEEVVWASGTLASRLSVYVVDDWMLIAAGTWLPSLTTKTTYRHARGGEEQLASTERTEVLSIALNVSLADDVFRIDLPETIRLVTWP